MKSDKLIAVHNGALGDFLCAWPALLALARGAGTPGTRPDDAGPEHAVAQGGKGGDAPRLLFAGNMERMRWLAPLGYAPCPPDMRRALDGLYGEPETSVWPQALAGATLAWFCLDRAPVAAHPRVVPLPCLSSGADGGGMDGDDTGVEVPAMALAARPGNASHANHASHVSHIGPTGQTRHVTETLRYRLERAVSSALPWPPRWDENWHGTWQALFGGWDGGNSRTVVLVPGAGHRAKQWPPSRFAAVAGELRRAGYNPLYVLGPAELERGLDRNALMPEGMPEGGEVPVVTPADHYELAQLLRSARLVIGNDSGPLHLASLHGVPVLALFGPAPASAWCPHGAAPLTISLSSPLECAPCSTTLRRLACGWGHGSGSPHEDTGHNGTSALDGPCPCMAAITVQTALDNALKLLGPPERKDR
uniref:Glycosyl transferase family 9 n=1 Tax=Nitratidesulfovibrio vulgaris (strain DSM 19637 / Miyazaki F) TaxID=883 RepID=B8DL96_NITV9